MNDNFRLVLTNAAGVVLGGALALGALFLYSNSRSGATVINTDLSAQYQGDVPILVTLKGCPACADAKKWLADNNVTIKMLDTADNKDAVEKLMKEVHSDRFPTLVLRGQIVVGFDKGIYQSKLKK